MKMHSGISAWRFPSDNGGNRRRRHPCGGGPTSGHAQAHPSAPAGAVPPGQEGLPGEGRCTEGSGTPTQASSRGGTRSYASTPARLATRRKLGITLAPMQQLVPEVIVLTARFADRSSTASMLPTSKWSQTFLVSICPADTGSSPQPRAGGRRVRSPGGARRLATAATGQPSGISSRRSTGALSALEPCTRTALAPTACTY
jgi:hypothetical protein